MRIRFLLIFFILSRLSLATSVQNDIDFKAFNKSEINSLEEAVVNLELINNSNRTLLIPNVISLGNILGDHPNEDILFEVYKEVPANSFVLLNPCSILSNPQIPEKGIVLDKYRKGTKFICKKPLPVSCIYAKGQYKIRYIFFIKDSKGKLSKIRSNWYYFKITHDLL